MKLFQQMNCIAYAEKEMKILEPLCEGARFYQRKIAVNNECESLMCECSHSIQKLNHRKYTGA